MRITTYFILFGLVMLTWRSGAQTQEVTFTQITGKSGVPIGKINAIAQDQHGFVWFSDQTNRCLIRYDGTSMTRYPHDPDNPNSLGGFYPESLFIDKEGIIWIGFFGQGLDRFDPYTNTFTHYQNDPDDPESLVHNTVSWVIMDHLGMVWVGTDGGLDRLDPASGKFTHFIHDPDDPTSLSGNMVRRVYEDSEGVIWVGVGFPYSDVDDGGLNRLDRETGQFTRYLHDPNDPKSLKGNQTRAILEDSQGNFWVGTDQNGLHWMDREKGTFERFEYDPQHPSKLAPPPMFSEISHISFIEEDAAGHIWIGTPDNGINRYNPTTGQVVTYGSLVNGAYPDQSGWVLHAADNGLLWLGNQESNLFQIDIYAYKFPFEPIILKDLFLESDSVLWQGTRDGLVRENLLTGEQTRYIHDPNDPTTLSHDVVDDIIKDHLGRFWIATPGGLNQFDPTTGVFTRYYHSENDRNSLTTNDLDKLYIDSQQNLWIGTQSGGLNKMNLNTLEMDDFIPLASNENSVRGRNTIDIIEDRHGMIWLAHFDNDGIDRYDPEQDVFTNYLFGLSAFSLYIDHEQVLWAGTQNGLYRYDDQTDSFIDQKIGTYVNSMIEDQNHNLWFGTGDGIYRLDESRKHFVQFGRTSDVIASGQWWTNGTLEMPDGQILLTENDGLYSFYPDKIKANEDSSILYITQLLLDGQSELVPDVRTKMISGELNLAHSQNIFGLGFGEIDFRGSQEALIYCKLEGYDLVWREAYPRQVVNYFKVPSGSYELKVRAANSSSGYETFRSMTIIIAPPWWQTWWAYTLYVIIFAGGVFVVDRFQRRRLLAKERARTQAKELEQAREIEKAYNQLKETQAQLVHSEKMASLGELTAGIAHEIQNPLNFVNNFSDVNKELVDELEQEIEKGDKEEIKAILKDIRDNEEKVTHHGKRAEGIVKSMLQHSRGTEGEKEPTDINALCDEYLRLAYHGFRAKDQSFNCDYSLELDPDSPKVEVVPHDIGRVLLNLINNAFQAVSSDVILRPSKETEESTLRQAQGDTGPRVVVSTKMVNDRIQITVSDNGPGIPDEIKDKIFQPFFTTKETGQGTGLGLSLSYDIVTKGHGGQLKVESEKDQGSKFVIHLPVKHGLP